MSMVFTLAVFGVLVGTIGLLGGTIYVLMGLGVVRFEHIEIPSWFLVLILIISSLVLGTIISYIVSKFVLKTANRIAEGMRELASGRFDIRLDLGKNQDSKQLESAFNKLAEELESIQMLRADFVNEFAHEFKTPIVSIKGFAELLTKEGLSEEQRKEYLSVIIEETERLSNLASSSLNFSKIEKQRILTDVVKFNVSEQIRSTLLLLEKKWAKKQLSLNVDIDEYEIIANEELLKQVWINVLDNAIKFSFENGELIVNSELKNDTITFGIKNKGIPIADKDREKIFDKFYRPENVKDVEGNGVGLAIVKKIIDLHGGSVTVDSNDGYTEFLIVLPKAKKLQYN